METQGEFQTIAEAREDAVFQLSGEDDDAGMHIVQYNDESYDTISVDDIDEDDEDNEFDVVDTIYN